MSKVDEITRESWILGTFPEWGTWLNEEIEQEEVKPGTVAMWWLGCTGIWFKTPQANITVDLWAGNGKRTHGDGKMKVGHQMANMCGCRNMQPNLRAVPFVIDPFAIKQVDAVLATHYHQDHMSAEYASHVLKSGMMTTDESGKEMPVPFIGPKKSVELWQKWGVPADRCLTVRPGDTIKIKDIEIVVLDSFDRTCIVTTDSTGPDREDLRGKCPTDMDDKAVNYLIKTPGGNIYHSGDSHYSIYYADPQEINLLYNYKKDVLDYKFHPFIWDVGGKYVYPTDKNKRMYHYRRGFEDCFEEEQNIPYRSCL